MVTWKLMNRYSTLALVGSIGITTSIYYQYVRKPVVHASWTVSDKLNSPLAKWDPNWDFRNPSSLCRPMRNDSIDEQNRYNNDLEQSKSKATRHIVLIRHGEYLEQGVQDEHHHLTALGRAQAQYTGKRLNDLFTNWDNVIVSTMTRAKETCDIILKEIDYSPEMINKCSLIREGAPIPPEPPVGHWKVELAQFFCDGARIEAGFRRYFHRACPEQEKDSYTLIVAHANVIRYFVCRALQFPPEAWLRINLNHGSITWLSITPSGNVSVRCLGDTGFMPADMLTNRRPKLKKLPKA